MLCAACYCLFKIDDSGKGTFTHRDLSDMIHALWHMQSRGLIPRWQNHSGEHVYAKYGWFSSFSRRISRAWYQALMKTRTQPHFMVLIVINYGKNFNGTLQIVTRKRTISA